MIEQRFNPDPIFIPREREMRNFSVVLSEWLDQIKGGNSEAPLPTMEPSHNQKLAGLLVLLYGGGGYGKTTLLRRYYEVAKTAEWHQKAGKRAIFQMLHRKAGKLTISEIVDWEDHIPENDRGLFHTAARHEPDAASPILRHEPDAEKYFEMLCHVLATKLGKQRDGFRHYLQAASNVKEARQRAERLLDQHERGHNALGRLTSDLVLVLIAFVAPRLGQGLTQAHLDNYLKERIGEGVQVTVEQVTELYEWLRGRLDHQRLDASLNPALRLGLALGHDLRDYARNAPLLLFFDTYEVIAEGDHLLRIVMAGAGSRVGWVLAGRNDLWTNRWRGVEYGYQDLVDSRLALPVRFSADGIRAFGIGDIQEYFTQVSKQADKQGYDLPEITKQDASEIRDVTLGVPLAVQIAAGIYWQTSKVSDITEEDGQYGIIDGMVRRYLVHVPVDVTERAKLYGLALVRRANQRDAIAAALGLTSQQAENDFTSGLTRLQRSYGFIFTLTERMGKPEPALHEEVRYFLRRDLLGQGNPTPEFTAVIERLKRAHEEALQKLEDRPYGDTFKARIQDEEWVGVYLDLTEQHFWLNANDGVRYALPLMIVAATYGKREVAREVAEVGKFFEGRLQRPYTDWWQWATESFAEARAVPPMDPLKNLARLIDQEGLTFLAPLYDGRNELKAAISWKLGEASQGKDDDKSLQSFEKALTLLPDEKELRAAAAEAYRNVAYDCQIGGEYERAIELLNRAIELDPETAYAYYNLGLAYEKIREIDEAIKNYLAAIKRDSSFALAYGALGRAYYSSRKYHEALLACARAIELDPQNDTFHRLKNLVNRELNKVS